MYHGLNMMSMCRPVKLLSSEFTRNRSCRGNIQQDKCQGNVWSMYSVMGVWGGFSPIDIEL